MSALGRIDPVLLTITTEPPPAATMRSPTSAVRRKGPFRLTPTTLSHSSSVTPAREP
jgi:hypothetical protein